MAGNLFNVKGSDMKFDITFFGSVFYPGLSKAPIFFRLGRKPIGEDPMVEFTFLDCGPDVCHKVFRVLCGGGVVTNRQWLSVDKRPGEHVDNKPYQDCGFVRSPKDSNKLLLGRVLGRVKKFTHHFVKLSHVLKLIRPAGG